MGGLTVPNKLLLCFKDRFVARGSMIVSAGTENSNADVHAMNFIVSQLGFVHKAGAAHNVDQ